MCDKLTWDNSILSDADLAIPSGDPGFFQMLGESGNMFSLTGDFLDGVPPGAGAAAGTSSNAHKRPADDHEDGWDAEPPAKCQSTGKCDPQAARLKASREKQRRHQLNTRYADLATLIDPGKPPKSDRGLVLEDAIRTITQLRVENNQIKQINKFLEEKYQAEEHKRGQELYRHSMAVQNSMSQQMSQQQMGQQVSQQMSQQGAPGGGVLPGGGLAQGGALAQQQQMGVQPPASALGCAPGRQHGVPTSHGGASGPSGQNAVGQQQQGPMAQQGGLAQQLQQGGAPPGGGMGAGHPSDPHVLQSAMQMMVSAMQMIQQQQVASGLPLPQGGHQGPMPLPHAHMLPQHQPQPLQGAYLPPALHANPYHPQSALAHAQSAHALHASASHPQLGRGSPKLEAHPSSHSAGHTYVDGGGGAYAEGGTADAAPRRVDSPAIESQQQQQQQQQRQGQQGPLAAVAEAQRGIDAAFLAAEAKAAEAKAAARKEETRLGGAALALPRAADAEGLVQQGVPVPGQQGGEVPGDASGDAVRGGQVYLQGGKAGEVVGGGSGGMNWAGVQFPFPPMGGTPLGWPPANMVDSNLDSKLRPPAA